MNAYKAAHIPQVQINVAIHISTNVMTNFQCTFSMLSAAPTPRIAPIIMCSVESGNPVLSAIKTVMSAENCAIKPLEGVIYVI